VAKEATDAARKLAAAEGIDLEKVEGTGADGRITIDDVKAAAASKSDASGETPEEGPQSEGDDSQAPEPAVSDGAEAPAEEPGEGGDESPSTDAGPGTEPSEAAQYEDGLEREEGEPGGQLEVLREDANQDSVLAEEIGAENADALSRSNLAVEGVFRTDETGGTHEDLARVSPTLAVGSKAEERQNRRARLREIASNGEGAMPDSDESRAAAGARAELANERLLEQHEAALGASQDDE